jgi:hypothetical protein
MAKKDRVEEAPRVEETHAKVELQKEGVTTAQAQFTELIKKLKVGKAQYNSFGKYNYRTTSDILEGVKPLLPEGAVLNVTDDVIEVGGRVYVEATAEYRHADFVVTSRGFAREEENRKGMDGAQLTGACSSYARKYALSGLLLLDEGKDADGLDNREQGKTEVKDYSNDIEKAINLDQLKTIWQSIPLEYRAKYAEQKDGKKARLEADDVPFHD